MKEIIEQIELKAKNTPTNTKENRRVKGAYVDCLMMLKANRQLEQDSERKYSKAEMIVIVNEYNNYISCDDTSDLDFQAWIKQNNKI